MVFQILSLHVNSMARPEAHSRVTKKANVFLWISINYTAEHVSNVMTNTRLGYASAAALSLKRWAESAPC
jgi:hypothetical protein